MTTGCARLLGRWHRVLTVLEPGSRNNLTPVPRTEAKTQRFFVPEAAAAHGLQIAPRVETAVAIEISALVVSLIPRSTVNASPLGQRLAGGVAHMLPARCSGS